MLLNSLTSTRCLLPNCVGLALLVAVVFAGAGTSRGDDQAKRPTDRPTAENQKPPDNGSKETKDTQEHQTPIECPLRKAGINPHDLKPFKEVEKYIEFLERPDRRRWQKPDEVVSVLGLRGDETVVDLGAGSGYFTFRFAKALPRGRVVALDVQPEMARHIHHKAMSEDVSNVEVQVADPNAPKLPPGADVVFICDVLHHVQQRSQWLKSLHAQMRSGSRLVLVEFKAGKLPEGPPEAIKVPKAVLVALVQEAGFRLKRDEAKVLPYQEYLIFEKP